MTKNVSSWFFPLLYLLLPHFPDLINNNLCYLPPSAPTFFTSFPLCPISKTWWTHWYCSLRKETSNKKIIFNDELILKHPGRFALGFPYIISSFCFLGSQLTYTKLFLTSSCSQTSFLFIYFFLLWSCRFQYFHVFFFFSFFFPLNNPHLPISASSMWKEAPPKIRANKF